METIDTKPRKHIDEIYKDWCGESHLTNSCHPVHDSAETTDFAAFYHNERAVPLREMLKKILSIEDAVFNLRGLDIVRLKSEINKALTDAS